MEKHCIINVKQFNKIYLKNTFDYIGGDEVMKKVLAIDMGATSIRGMIGYVENNQLVTKEVMRMSHKIIKKRRLFSMAMGRNNR